MIFHDRGNPGMPTLVSSGGTRDPRDRLRQKPG